MEETEGNNDIYIYIHENRIYINEDLKKLVSEENIQKFTTDITWCQKLACHFARFRLIYHILNLFICLGVLLKIETIYQLTSQYTNKMKTKIPYCRIRSKTQYQNCRMRHNLYHTSHIHDRSLSSLDTGTSIRKVYHSKLFPSFLMAMYIPKGVINGQNVKQWFTKHYTQKATNIAQHEPQ